MNPANARLVPDSQLGADVGFIPDTQPGADIGFIPDPPSFPPSLRYAAAIPPWTDVGFIPDVPNDLGFIPDPPLPRYVAASQPAPAAQFPGIKVDPVVEDQGPYSGYSPWSQGYAEHVREAAQIMLSPQNLVRGAAAAATGLARTVRDVLNPETYLPEELRQKPFVIDAGGDLRPMTDEEIVHRDPIQVGRGLYTATRNPVNPEGSDAARMLERWTTPEGLLMIPAGMTPAGAALLTANLAPDLVRQVPDLVQGKGTEAEKRDRINDLFAMVAMLAGAHAVKAAREQWTPEAVAQSEVLGQVEEALREQQVKNLLLPGALNIRQRSVPIEPVVPEPPPENVAPTAGESGETENADAPAEPAGAPEVPLHQQIFDLAAAMRDLQETLRAYQIPSPEPPGLGGEAEAAGQLIAQALRRAEEANAALQEPRAGARAPTDGADTAGTGLLPRAMEELLRGPREQVDTGGTEGEASQLQERAQGGVDDGPRAALDSQAEAASGEVTRLASAAPQTEAPEAVGGALSPAGRGFGPENAPGNRIQKVNGRNPINSRYAGQAYPMAKLSRYLQEKYPNGVRFKPTGFLELSPYAIAEVKVEGLTGAYNHDAGLANKEAGFLETPDGFTWHHVEDGETMQLVPTDLHKAVGHTGGGAVIRGRALIRFLLQLMSNGVTGKPAQPALQGSRQGLAKGPGNSS
jgi:hypothetical protein